MFLEQAGADGITVHLREDRRHIQERDVELLRALVKTLLNLEMAPTEAMVAFAERVKPDMVTLVPESREELTMTHVVGAGRLARARTVILDDARRDAEIRWVHPPVEDVPADGLTVELLVVARDGRGGTDWTRRALCLVP